MIRTVNLPLRFRFSPALVVSMALTYPANRRTRNLSHPIPLNLFKVNPATRDNHFTRSDVTYQQQFVASADVCGRWGWGYQLAAVTGLDLQNTPGHETKQWDATLFT
jgi:hypothetical protein